MWEASTFEGKPRNQLVVIPCIFETITIVKFGRKPNASKPWRVTTDSESHPLKVIHMSKSEVRGIERAESITETPGLTLIQNKETDN